MFLRFSLKPNSSKYFQFKQSNLYLYNYRKSFFKGFRKRHEIGFHNSFDVKFFAMSVTAVWKWLFAIQKCCQAFYAPKFFSEKNCYLEQCVSNAFFCVDDRNSNPQSFIFTKSQIELDYEDVDNFTSCLVISQPIRQKIH